MKWEYEAVRLINSKLVHGIDLTKLLNEFGQDEWELVSSDLEQDCFIFKRPVRTSFVEYFQDHPEMVSELMKGSAGID